MGSEGKTITAPDWKVLQEAFLDLLDHEPAEREARLGRLPPVLREELRAMLRAHGEGELDVESRLLEVSEPHRAIDLRLGAYRIVREIGSGGMGTVYLAERCDDYRQQVAIKIMRWGLGGAETARRFRRERQILARLDHPRIARLLDGGVSDDGRPYLVMPFLEGESITEFCDRRRLGISARLELFVEVCEAVEAAHRRLVVHRDLKPSNILVREVDGRAEVTLLDFGIAKLLEDDEAPAVTRSELRMMTPEYAAPEQLRGEEVTTATDTWALGILLQELLSGERPFRAAGRSRSHLEAEICERTPAAPSLAVRRRLEAHDGSGEEAAGRRATTGAKLVRRLRGDLDTIVLRALAKEPDRRYGSARQLSDDVRRHLEDRPVLARPDGAGYRLSRFVARHTWQVVATSVIVLLGVLFAVTSWLQSRQLERERDEARLERRTAEQVADVLVELFELADPSKTPDGRLLATDELLEMHSDRVLDRLEGQDAVQARLRHILGRVHHAHSQFDRSRALLEAALEQRRRLAGPDDPEILEIEHDLALLARSTGDRERAERLLRDSLEKHRRRFGERHESVARCLQDLAAVLPDELPEKRELLERSLELFRELEVEPGVAFAGSLNDLALIDMGLGRLDDAIERLRRSREIVESLHGPLHPYTLAVQGNLAVVFMKSSRFAEALEAERDVLEKRRDIHGTDSVAVAKSLNNLGNVLGNLGRFRESEASLSEAREIWLRLVGEEHFDAVNTTRNLARVIELQGREEEALELLRRAAAVRDPGLGDYDFPFFANQRAALAMRLGRPDDAVRELEGLLEGMENVLPPEDDRIVQTLVLLAEARLEASDDRPDEGERARAASEYRRALENRLGQGLGYNVVVAEAACGLARALAGLGGTGEARKLFGECLETYDGWGLVHEDTRRAVHRAAERVGISRATDSGTASGSLRNPGGSRHHGRRPRRSSQPRASASPEASPDRRSHASRNRGLDEGKDGEVLAEGPSDVGSRASPR